MSKPKVQTRCAPKLDLFADAASTHKIEALGNPLQVLARHIDVDHLTRVMDKLLPRVDARQGGRLLSPTAVMVRILTLKYLDNLSDQQIEHRRLDRVSCSRFSLLADSTNIPDCSTLWHYQQRLDVDGLTALSQAVDGQLLQHGDLLARCGQIIDTTLVSAPTLQLTKHDKAQLEQGNIPADLSQAERRQKDLDVTLIKKHGKSYSDYKRSISVGIKHNFVRKITTDKANGHKRPHFHQVLDQRNSSRDVYADGGLLSAQRGLMLTALGYRDRIQREAKPGNALSKCQKRHNKRITKIRVRAESPFARMRRIRGKRSPSIGWARATVAMMAACYNVRRLAKFLDDG
jgi:IS5 family transposase